MPGLLGRGYCGGHVTLIFTIEDSDLDPVNQGSRGVGICLEEGVETVSYTHLTLPTSDLV